MLKLNVKWWLIYNMTFSTIQNSTLSFEILIIYNSNKITE